MNNESPLVPQGSFLEQKNKGRTRVKIAVFIVLAIHGIGLMALLMQGCQKAPDSAKTGPETNATAQTTQPLQPTFSEPTNPPIARDPAPPIIEGNAPLVQPPVMPDTFVSPPVGNQHKIVSGDTLARLAKYYKVSVKAIEQANPGIDPNRLKVDKVIQIPPPSQSAPSAPANPAATADAGGKGGRTYKVVSGDTLNRIAKKHGVSVRALKAANGLRTDGIKVNEVLKIPASTTTASGPPANGVPPQFDSLAAGTSAPAGVAQ